MAYDVSPFSFILMTTETVEGLEEVCGTSIQLKEPLMYQKFKIYSLAQHLP